MPHNGPSCQKVDFSKVLFFNRTFFEEKNFLWYHLDVGPSNFLISSNHWLKRREVVVKYTISKDAENNGPLKRLRHSTIVPSKSDWVWRFSKWKNKNPTTFFSSWRVSFFVQILKLSKIAALCLCVQSRSVPKM